MMTDEKWMQAAIHLAACGEGCVEPNPMVGCVLVSGNTDSDEAQKIGAGYHQKFGGPHAEIEAINSAMAAGISPEGSTAYVTLEPCSHTGKTGPCTEALIAAKVARVVVADEDPYPEVRGQGIARLREAGIDVKVGVLAQESRRLNAPYLKRVTTGLPWVIAKWAMTMDGKIATANGDSQWISCDASREIVHQLRARVDGVLVGSGTALADDPQLTTRLNRGEKAARVAKRIVIDSSAQLSLESRLVKTANEFPVWIATGPESEAGKREQLAEAGCHVWNSSAPDRNDRLLQFLNHLVTEVGLTNVLVEGGGQLLGSLFEMDLIDEIHAFVAPKLIGGKDSLSPIEGNGVQKMGDARQFELLSTEIVGDDVYSVSRRVVLAR